MEYEEGSLPEAWKKFRQGKKPVENNTPMSSWFCPVVKETTSPFLCTTCSRYKRRDGCLYGNLEKENERGMEDKHALKNGDTVKVSNLAGEVHTGRPCITGRFIGFISDGRAVIEVDGVLSFWPFVAKLVTYTHRELVEKIGHDFVYAPDDAE